MVCVWMCNLQVCVGVGGGGGNVWMNTLEWNYRLMLFIL